MRTSEHGFLLRPDSGRARSGIVHRFVPPVPYTSQIAEAMTACGVSSPRFWLWEGPQSERMLDPEQTVLNGWPPCRRCYPEFDAQEYDRLHAIDEWLLFEQLWNEQTQAGSSASP